MPWILGSVVVANSYSIIVHTWYGVVQGPAVILDFIGMGAHEYSTLVSPLY